MSEAGDTPTHHGAVVLPLASSQSLAPPHRRNALSLFHRRQGGAHAFEYFRSHPDRFTKGGMGMGGVGDMDLVTTHLDREAEFADQVSGMGSHDASAKNTVVRLIE